MDMVAGIDDEHCVRLIRLFNEEAGKNYLRKAGVPGELVDRLDLFGISSVANLGLVSLNDIIWKLLTI